MSATVRSAGPRRWVRHCENCGDGELRSIRSVALTEAREHVCTPEPALLAPAPVVSDADRQLVEAFRRL